MISFIKLSYEKGQIYYPENGKIRMGGDHSSKELSRKHGVSAGILYTWRKKYGGMEASDLKRLKNLEEENNININSKMNNFLIRTAIKFNQLNPNSKDLVYDFDHQFILANKYDATSSYKNKKATFRQ